MIIQMVISPVRWLGLVHLLAWQVSLGSAWNSKSFVDSLFIRPAKYDKMFGKFNDSERIQMLKLARDTFVFAYDNYMQHAFPSDELNPVYCNGRGPDLNDRY